jgi:hypothetical protein
MPIFYLPYLWYIKGLLWQLWPLAAIFSLLLFIPCLFRCLQDHLGELSGQTFHQMLWQPSPAYHQWPVCKWSLGKTIRLHSWGPHTFPKFWLDPLLNNTHIQQEVDQLVPIIPTKGWKRCKELQNKDHTTWRKERFIEAQTAGMTLGFRVQQLGWNGEWAV